MRSAVGYSAANPEFHLRGGLVDGEVVELAVEGRATLPLEDNSRATVLFGMPYAAPELCV